MKKILYGLLFIIINIAYADNWGAIYIDTKTGIAGGATDFSSDKGAHDVALKSCADKHQKKGIKHNCKMAVGAANACMTVYWSPVNNKVGGAYGTFQNDTQNVARRECEKKGGKNCQLSMSICSTRMIFY